MHTREYLFRIALNAQYDYAGATRALQQHFPHKAHKMYTRGDCLPLGVHRYNLLMIFLRRDSAKGWLSQAKYHPLIYQVYDALNERKHSTCCNRFEGRSRYINIPRIMNVGVQEITVRCSDYTIID